MIVQTTGNGGARILETDLAAIEKTARPGVRALLSFGLNSRGFASIRGLDVDIDLRIISREREGLHVSEPADVFLAAGGRREDERCLTAGGSGKVKSLSIGIGHLRNGSFVVLVDAALLYRS